MKLKADTSDLKDLEKTMQKLGKQVPRIVAITLNTQSFLMKNRFIPESLQKNFTIRNEKFLARQTRVNMAKKTGDPQTNFSEVGIMSAPRFTALEEQQTGKDPKKRRAALTDSTRGGSVQKKQRPSTRMKPGTWRRQSQYKGRSKKHRFFQMLKETRENKLNFVVSKGLGNVMSMAPGLYGWKGKKLKMLQSFEKQEVKKVDWMGDALDGLFKHQGDFTDVFIREMEKALRRASK